MMPLAHGKSDQVFRQNVSEMIRAGHPRAQALAAAYREKRGFADGGVPLTGMLGANSSVSPPATNGYATMPPAAAISQPAFSPRPFSSALSQVPMSALSGGEGSNGIVASVNGQGIPSGSPSAPRTVANSAFTPPTPPPSASASDAISQIQYPTGYNGTQPISAATVIPQNKSLASLYGDQGVPTSLTDANPSLNTGVPFSQLPPQFQSLVQQYVNKNGLARGGRARRFAAGGIPTSEALDPWYTRSEERGMIHPEGLIASTGAGRTDVHNINVPSGSYIIPADVTSGLAEGNTLAGAAVLDRMMHSNPYGIQGGGGRHGSGPPRAPSVRPYQEPAFNPRALDQPVKSGGAIKRASGGSANPKPGRKPVEDFDPRIFKDLSRDDIARALPPNVIPDSNPPSSNAPIHDLPSPGQTQVPWGGDSRGGKAGKQQDGMVPIVVAGGEMLYHPATIIKKFGSLKKGHAALDAFVKRIRTENVKTLKALPGPKK